MSHPIKSLLSILPLVLFTSAILFGSTLTSNAQTKENVDKRSRIKKPLVTKSPATDSPSTSSPAKNSPSKWEQRRKQASNRGFPLLKMLSNKRVRDDIELSEGQFDEIKKLAEDFDTKLIENHESLSNLPSDVSGEARIEAMEEFNQTSRDLMVEFSEKFNRVLISHQLTRLKQIESQQVFATLQRRDFTGLLTEPMIELLEIDEDQQVRIQNRAIKAQNELQKKIAKLTEEARLEVLEELNSSQKKKLKKILGSPLQDQN